MSSSKTAKKTSSSAAAAGKKMVVSFSSDSDDDDKTSSSSSSSSSSESSSSDESDAPATKPKAATPPPPTTTTTTTTTTNSAEADEEETVSFTLSLSTVHIDDSATEELPKTEEKLESTPSTLQESKGKVTVPSPSPSPPPSAVVEEVKELRAESQRKSPDVAVKLQQENEDTETKKITTKKSTKAGTKAAKVQAINGAEDIDEERSKMKKQAAAAEEIVSVQTEPAKNATIVADDASNVMNGETKTTTKTVKKKTTKKSSTDSTTDSVSAAAEEKPVTKESVKQNQAVTKTESPKALSTTEETASVVNGEPQSTTKTVKKKVKKQSDTSTTTVTKEKEREKENEKDKEKETEKEKDSKPTKEKAVSNERIEQDGTIEKFEPVKTSPAVQGDAESNALKEEPKAATKTTVIKKKTKKASGEVSSSKNSNAQEDTTPSVENSTVTATENSLNKTADDAAKLENSQDVNTEKLSTETKKTAASSNADKDSAGVTDTAAADKTVTKKKKVKKTTPASSSSVDSGETKSTISGEAQETSKSPSNVDDTVPAAAETALPGNAPDNDATDNIITKSADVKPTTLTSVAPDAVDESIANKSAATSEETPAPVAPVIATSEEIETSNIVTLIQLDDNTDEASTGTAVQVLSVESKPEVVEPTITHMDISADAAAKDDVSGETKNEESDFSYRRKSMDDFIKRILAEAREEQQKRMSATTNSTSDTANLLDIDSATRETEKLGSCLSPTSTEASMLDRRLASTDRKRLQKEEPGERTLTNATEDIDLDQDLAEIGRYFAKRNTTGNSRYDLEVEKGPGDMSGSRIRDIRELDADAGNSNTVVNHRTQQNGVTEDSFVPRAREETADVVRTSSRPVRAIIDQQSDVVQLLKSTARGIDDLEAEIRGLRATFLDRQARIETLHKAVDAELRAYQADQHAANERIQQQQIPGGHFVRDEFMRANNIGPSYRSSAVEDLLGASSPRRRSGSVSSTSGLVGGGVGPSGMSSNDLDYKSSALSSWVLGSRLSAIDQPRRNDVDDDASSTASGFSVTRSRRGGSVVRERSYFSEDQPGSTTRSYLLPSYDTSTPSSYSYSSTLTSGYSPMTSSSLRSYYQTDYGPSSSSAAVGSSYYGGRETRDYQGSSDSTSYGYSPFRSSAINDPSRFRRAQSVSDFSSERSLGGGDRYNTASSSTSGQFQSRFLDKVRSRKSQGDDQYRSRFLASDSGSSSRYYSGRRGYSSND